MEKILHLENKFLQIKGATKIISTSPTQSVVEREGELVVITGSKLEVKKLNLEENEVCIEGSVSNIKIGEGRGKKESLLKRIFK